MVDESGSAINVIAMTDETPIVMESCEYEMIELFRKINLSRPIAHTLAFLAKGREISSQNIEMLSGLRQPEVSLAMRYLQKNNWIEFREEKKSKGKGRPVKMYRLTVPLNQIIGKLEEAIIAENRQVLGNIELLKKIPDTYDTE
jgi:predicted transcriptional regulator